jgi:hypothetical protein
MGGLTATGGEQVTMYKMPLGAARSSWRGA